MIKNRIVQKILKGTNTKLIDISLLILRITIGVILFMVGSGKVLGWFGGFGFKTTVMFYNKMGFSTLLTYLSSYTEFIGGILLIFGLITRPAAFAVMINMIVATIVLLPNGFIGQNGASYPFTVLIIDIVILLVGPMKYSIDEFVLNSENNKN